jgi:hypothetical protein
LATRTSAYRGEALVHYDSGEPDLGHAAYMHAIEMTKQEKLSPDKTSYVPKLDQTVSVKYESACAAGH